MLTHCDFVFAGESAKFQMPFVNLAVVPEFGTSYSVPARIGYLRAAELVLLGLPFDAKRAAELGLVTRVVADQQLFPTATAAAQQLAVKPPVALQSCKRLDEIVHARATRARGKAREPGILRARPLGRSQRSVHGLH